MGKKIERIGVITSGGDAPGMNAAIRAVVRACAYYNIECLGAYRGYQGLIEGDFKMLSPRHVSNIINRGGTMLKSARSSEFRTKEGRAKAYKEIKKAEIDALVLIGGDGTFTGGMIFNEEYNFPVMGIPGTIDNDIFGTSHTLGFDTALNTVVEAVDKIRDAIKEDLKIGIFADSDLDGLTSLTILFKLFTKLNSGFLKVSRLIIMTNKKSTADMDILLVFSNSFITLRV